MKRPIEIVQRFAPNALPNYVEAFEKYADQLFVEYEINTPLRMAHFMAQIFHEAGGDKGALTIKRESGKYTAKRIVEIFGVNNHSAAVTAAEAKKLAGNEYELFERVYGLGNPKKAKDLGNTRSGDGFLFRGNGPLQTTGGADHKDLGQKVGVGTLFYDNPDAVTWPKYALLPALAEWKRGNCNKLADRNDIRSITKKINGGYNGYDERVMWFNKLFAAMSDDAAPAWKVAKPDQKTRKLQSDLVALGYSVNVDGRYGEKTTDAVAAFQKKAGIRVDGIAGDVTLATIKARLSTANAGGAPAPDLAKPSVPVPTDAAAGLGTTAIGEMCRQGADAIQPYTDLHEGVRWVAFGLMAVGGCIIGYATIRHLVVPYFTKSKLAVAA